MPLTRSGSTRFPAIALLLTLLLPGCSTPNEEPPPSTTTATPAPTTFQIPPMPTTVTAEYQDEESTRTLTVEARPLSSIRFAEWNQTETNLDVVVFLNQTGGTRYITGFSNGSGPAFAYDVEDSPAKSRLWRRSASYTFYDSQLSNGPAVLQGGWFAYGLLAGATLERGTRLDLDLAGHKVGATWLSGTPKQPTMVRVDYPPSGTLLLAFDQGATLPTRICRHITLQSPCVGLTSLKGAAQGGLQAYSPSVPAQPEARLVPWNRVPPCNPCPFPFSPQQADSAGDHDAGLLAYKDANPSWLVGEAEYAFDSSGDQSGIAHWTLLYWTPGKDAAYRLRADLNIIAGQGDPRTILVQGASASRPAHVGAPTPIYGQEGDLGSMMSLAETRLGTTDLDVYWTMDSRHVWDRTRLFAQFTRTEGDVMRFIQIQADAGELEYLFTGPVPQG